jgi:hypothetical protein
MTKVYQGPMVGCHIKDRLMTTWDLFPGRQVSHGVHSLLRHFGKQGDWHRKAWLPKKGICKTQNLKKPESGQGRPPFAVYKPGNSRSFCLLHTTELMSLLRIPFVLSAAWALHVSATPPNPPPEECEKTTPTGSETIWAKTLSLQRVIAVVRSKFYTHWSNIYWSPCFTRLFVAFGHSSNSLWYWRARPHHPHYHQISSLSLFDPTTLRSLLPGFASHRPFSLGGFSHYQAVSLDSPAIAQWEKCSHSNSRFAKNINSLRLARTLSSVIPATQPYLWLYVGTRPASWAVDHG